MLKEGVVVIGGHAQGLGIIRSLGSKKIPVILVDSEPVSLGMFSRYTSKTIRCPGFENHLTFVKFLIKLSQKMKLRNWQLFPTDDNVLECLSIYQNVLKFFYIIDIPTHAKMRLMLNKYYLYNRCEKLDIPQPKTFTLGSIDELGALSKKLKYPFIIKPALIHNFYKKAKVKAYICRDTSELHESYSKATTHIATKDIMIQEMIAGSPDNLFSFCSLSNNGEVLAKCIAKRPRQRPMDFGNATTFAMTVDCPDIENFSRQLLKDLKYTGLSEIEYKWDSKSKEYKLLEINPRTWKWHSLAIDSGIDFPYMFYNMANISNKSMDYKRNVKWVHISVDFFLVLSEIIKGKMSFESYAKSLRGTTSFAVYSKSDILPFISSFLLLPYHFLSR